MRKYDDFLAYTVVVLLLLCLAGLTVGIWRIALHV